jgi:hypothetical protein
MATHDRKIFGKLINDGLARGNFQSHDFLVADVRKMFDDPADRISVGDDEDALAGGEGGRDLGLIIGDGAGDRVLEALGVRHFNASITPVAADIVRTVIG